MKNTSCDSGICAAMARDAESVDPSYLGFVSEAHSKGLEKVLGIYM